jgi:two-component system LytT family sensor kinase
MAAESMRTSRVVALALVVGSFFVAQEVFVDLVAGKPLALGPRAVVAVCFWLAWAPLVPIVRYAVQRWPLDARPAYLIHAAIGVVLAAVQTGIALGLQIVVRALRTNVGVLDALRHGYQPVPYVWGTFTAIVFYVVVVMVYTALRYRTLYTESKLETLRSQLRPHFLFNTLNAISVIVAEDADKAQQLLLRLATLLRRSLDEEAHEVPLAQELGFVNDYLDIQRGRFGDQLIVRLDVDPAVLQVSVPVFLFQPLLENAIEHGKFEDRPTTVSVVAGRENGMLRIAIADDGPGMSASVPPREGIGLSNTRARLRHLYGPGATIDLSAAAHGALVEIRIPMS